MFRKPLLIGLPWELSIGEYAGTLSNFKDMLIHNTVKYHMFVFPDFSGHF